MNLSVPLPSPSGRLSRKWFTALLASAGLLAGGSGLLAQAPPAANGVNLAMNSDWSQWRGANRDGVSCISAENAAPVVVGGRDFVMACDLRQK